MYYSANHKDLKTLTMHQVRLVKFWVIWVNSIWIRAALYVVLQVPTQVLIHHTEHQEDILVHIVAD